MISLKNMKIHIFVQWNKRSDNETNKGIKITQYLKEDDIEYYFIRNFLNLEKYFVC